MITARSLRALDYSAEYSGPAGLLEAVWSTPRQADPSTVAVVCHPHPLHGGNLNNKITLTLAHAFCGLGVRTVRFNFRGAGGSEGSHDYGRGETEDLLAVVDQARRHHSGCTLWLAGFSFGAYVALRAAQRIEVDRLITIAPPVNLYDFSALVAPPCPWLLIQGTADDVVPCKEVAKWASRLYPAPESVFLDGIDHYFHGQLNTLRSLLVERITAHTLSHRAIHIA